jgi:hypothetical protein
MAVELVALLLINGCSVAGIQALALLELRRDRSKWIAGAAGILGLTFFASIVLLCGIYVMLEGTKRPILMLSSRPDLRGSPSPSP